MIGVGIEDFLLQKESLAKLINWKVKRKGLIFGLLLIFEMRYVMLSGSCLIERIFEGRL